MLFGVLVVNLLTAFRVSIFQQFTGASDGVLERIVHVMIEEKAFSLFALLFGIGLAMQFERLSGSGRPLYWLARRLAVLLAFGLVHLLLIWNGDILTEYALAGFLALPFLLVRRASLLLAAFIMLGIYAYGPLLYSIPWPGPAALQAHVAAANHVYSSGSFAEIRQLSVRELPWILSLHAFVFPRTLALFLFGMFLWRAGIVRRSRELRHELVLAAVAGIAGGAALTYASFERLGIVLWALGYGAGLLLLAQFTLFSVCAPMGRMAFTNYVVQSILFGLIFFGYGLGRFGMGATPALAIGIAVYAAQVLGSRWWLARYRYGPLEWLWRSLMYGAPQPMRTPRTSS